MSENKTVASIQWITFPVKKSAWLFHRKSFMQNTSCKFVRCKRICCVETVPLWCHCSNIAIFWLNSDVWMDIRTNRQTEYSMYFQWILFILYSCNRISPYFSHIPREKYGQIPSHSRNINNIHWETLNILHLFQEGKSL